MSEEFARKAKEAGYDILLREEDGGHNWEYWDKCIKTDYFLYCKGNKCMSIMNINLFSMKLKRMIDITVILPDEIKSDEKL